MTYGLAPTLIFDGDNTLWRCGEYYNAVTLEGARRLKQYFGLDEVLGKELLDFIDLFAIRSSKDGGFQKDRIGRAFGAAAVAAQAAVTGEVNAAVAQEFCALGMSVFSAPYELYPDALRIVQALRDSGWRTLLYTKGDPEVQERKIIMNNVRSVFDGVHIVPKKDAATIKAICTADLVDVSQSWMIGDSFRDDIAPALEIGLKAVHVDSPDHRWGYETQQATPTATVSALPELIAIIPPLEANA